MVYGMYGTNPEDAGTVTILACVLGMDAYYTNVHTEVDDTIKPLNYLYAGTKTTV